MSRKVLAAIVYAASALAMRTGWIMPSSHGRFMVTKFHSCFGWLWPAAFACCYRAFSLSSAIATDFSSLSSGYAWLGLILERWHGICTGIVSFGSCDSKITAPRR
jgi:hypothetical protein